MSAQSNRQEASLSDNPNPHPQAVDSEPTPSRPVNTAFGLKQDAQRPHKTVFKDNYEERFPEDPYCQEVAPNARVWRTYEEEAAAYDAVMVGQSRDGLDVMLVFAGLFSAVVTSFLVQVCQKLEADFSQMSAILMHDLVLVQLSMAAGSSGPNLTAPSVDPTMVYSPDTVTVWVNGLWAVSLAASLIVAFAAVLVKPWLRHYASLPSGTPGARSHIRHYRFMGLEKWRVSVIIGLLPIIMNISLTLFFVGLILFFVPLQTSLASVISAITLTVTVLYFVSNAMPIFYPQCPYQTPLTDFVYRAFQAASSIRQHLFTHEEQKSCFSLRELETKVVSDNYDMLSVCAIDWLFDVSLNPTVHSVVVQALGGLPASIQSYTMEYPWRNGGEMARVRSESFGRIAAKLEPSPYSTNISSLACIVGRENICDRLMRSYLFLPSGHQYVVIDDGRDAPHFRASLWLRRPSSYLSAESSAVIRSRLRACLAFNCHVELHPLVLVNLMKVAIAYDVLAPANLNNSRECAVVIDLWFQATCTESKDHTLKNEPSMLEQVRTIPLSLTLAGVSNESNAFLQGHLLKFLSVHDNLQDSSFSLSFRLALAVGKFGVSHVAQHFSSRWCDLDGWRHLHLINCALDSLIDTPYSHAVIEPICCFIMNVIDTTPVCDYNPQLWENPVIGACLVHCLSQIRELLSAHNDIMLPPTRSASSYRSLLNTSYRTLGFFGDQLLSRTTFMKRQYMTRLKCSSGSSLTAPKGLIMCLLLTTGSRFLRSHG
ncbi:hypothetical protein CPB85DRAFT_398091 [Mucidula mucida]|nr:hypothetical protein CPB85DRAFT_398091 [Mucidula mucida]